MRCLMDAHLNASVTDTDLLWVTQLLFPLLTDLQKE